MRNLILLAFAILAMVAMSSCAELSELGQEKKPVVLVVLSQKIILDYELFKEDRFEKLQYYIGPTGLNTILKKTTKEKMDTIDENGKLIHLYQEKDSIVKINFFTKGVLIGAETNKFKISFFEDDNLFLVFGPSSNGEYILFGLEGKNKVLLGEDTFEVISGGNGTSKLLINLEEIKRYLKGEKTAPGRAVKKE